MDPIAARNKEIERIFQDGAFGNADALESWDGVDVAKLAEFLTEDEYQALVDALEAWDEDART